MCHFLSNLKDKSLTLDNVIWDTKRNLLQLQKKHRDVTEKKTKSYKNKQFIRKNTWFYIRRFNYKIKLTRNIPICDSLLKCFEASSIGTIQQHSLQKHSFSIKNFLKTTFWYFKIQGQNLQNKAILQLLCLLSKM